MLRGGAGLLTQVDPAPDKVVDLFCGYQAKGPYYHCLQTEYWFESGFWTLNLEPFLDPWWDQNLFLFLQAPIQPGLRESDQKNFQ